MAIIRTPMTEAHFDLIDPEPMLAGLKSQIDIRNVMACGKAMAWVDTERGEVVALGGYLVRREGVAWLWFLPSRRGSRMLLRMARFFRRWVATLDEGIRLEAVVLADFREGIRWVEFLGLKRETGEPMRRWDGESDYHLYARVTGESDDDEDSA
jgi:hypothetical protein